MKINYLIKLGFPALCLAGLMVACTDLEIEQSDSIITQEGTGIFGGVENVDASLQNLYNDIYGQLGTQENFFALNEVTTDEQLVPTRGTDWGDNGIWRTLHAHTWSPSHQYILNVWNGLNQNVFRATEIIDERSNPSAQQKAEAQFLRAFSMFFVMDMYGQQPFREPDEGADVNPRVMTRSEAYDFILQDLTEAIPNLPSVGPSEEQTARASKAAGYFLLAKLKLNAHIYKGQESPSNEDLQAVIDAVDNISGEGFALQEGYFDLFLPSVNSETIWYLKTSVGSRIWNGLHYNQNSPDNEGGGWNGFTTLSEFYDLFEGDPNTNFVGDGQEERRGWVPDGSTANDQNYGIGYGFLIGQQYDTDGSQLQTRAGTPLKFTKELPGLTGNGEETGIRVIKYHPFDGSDADSFRNHQVAFRFADAYLMKAEAMMRMGQDVTAMVNELRTLRGASPLSSISEQDMIDERGRELYIEFWRRNDLIRFGQYTRDWAFKNPESVNDETKRLFPIPPNALLSNPNLTQNPGY